MRPVRCPEPCGKVRYDSLAQGILASVLAAMDYGNASEVYHSENCLCFHLKQHRNGKPHVSGKTKRKLQPFMEGDENGYCPPQEGLRREDESPVL